MRDTNIVVLVGRATKDSVIKQIGEYSLLEFSIAFNGKKKDESNYIDVQQWGEISKTLQPMITKGKLISVEGRLKMASWESNGKRQTRHLIEADFIQVLSSKGEKASEPVTPENFDDGSDIPF